MSVLAEPPPNAFESLTTDAKTATHKGRLGSLNGDVHAVQLDIGTHIVRGLIVNFALDAVVVAERPFLVDAVVLGGGDFEVLNVDVFHVFVPLSFLSVYSITDRTGFVKYFFNFLLNFFRSFRPIPNRRIAASNRWASRKLHLYIRFSKG